MYMNVFSYSYVYFNARKLPASQTRLCGSVLSITTVCSWNWLQFEALAMYHLLQSVARSSVGVYVCTYDNDPYLTLNPNWTFHALPLHNPYLIMPQHLHVPPPSLTPEYIVSAFFTNFLPICSPGQRHLHTSPFTHLYTGTCKVGWTHVGWTHFTFARKIHTYDILKSTSGKVASESNSFLWTSLAFSLLTQTQPCSSSARPHVFVPHFSDFSLSSHCLYQWLYPVFHSSSSILRYNTSLLVVLTQQLCLNNGLALGIQQCVVICPSLP